MQVVSHLDPWVLEGELLERIAAVKRGDALAPVLVVVPTLRLAEHVRRRLVERFGAVVGVQVVTHRGLASGILSRRGGAVPRPLPRELSDALLAAAVRAAARGPIRDFVLSRPAALPALAATLRDLRDAGVSPERAGETLGADHRELIDLFRAFTASLDRLAARGLADDAALARSASGGAAEAGSRHALVVHHGAYDLIGVHADLLRALDRGREVVALVPDRVVEPFGPEPPGAGVGRDDLGRLIAGKSVSFAHAQGSRAELELACLESLAAVAAGAAPHDVAVLVRSFGPYAGAIEALGGAAEAPWAGSFVSPIRRDPGVAGLLQSLRDEEKAPSRRWSGHAAAIEERRAAAIGDDGSPAARRLEEIVRSMAALERDLDDAREVPHADAVAWLEAAVDASTAPLLNGAGPLVLDLMQARGLTFRRVALIGLNAGVFPRVGREDPLLPDEARRRLRAATGRPVPVPTETGGEERLLLALAVGSAAEALAVSWRRADEAGRPVVPSLALRELGAAAHASDDVEALRARARALPADPGSRLASLAARPGLLDADGEALLAALSDDRGEALAARRPELSTAIAWTEAVESFRAHATPCDGRIGARGPARWSVSAVETLGRCPLQFLFKHVLRVPEPETPPGPFEPARSALGTRVHVVLRDVYRRLGAEGAFAADPASARARAAELLAVAWRDAADSDEAERAARLPLLHGIDTALRLRLLESFVGSDLERLYERGLKPTELETDRDGALSLPSGRIAALSARFDRVAVGDDARVIGDYKTGGSLARRVDEGEMLSGLAMQVPLYALLGGAAVELLGVGEPPPAPGQPDPRFVSFSDFKSPERRRGFLETVDIVVDLAERGVFPMRPDRHCAWCAYRSACRKGHPASEFREERAADAAAARGVWAKSKSRPLVAGVTGPEDDS